MHGTQLETFFVLSLSLSAFSRRSKATAADEALKAFVKAELQVLLQEAAGIAFLFRLLGAKQGNAIYLLYNNDQFLISINLLFLLARRVEQENKSYQVSTLCCIEVTTKVYEDIIRAQVTDSKSELHIHYRLHRTYLKLS